MKPLISVIVPIYNSVNHLHECIDSILRQTYQNIEIILVDDGSDDGSEKVCDEYTVVDKRVRVLHKTNEGLVCARKSGFEMSRGEFIVFVDSDDWIDVDMFNNLQEIAERHSADVVVSAVINETSDYSVYKGNGIKTGVYTGDSLQKLKPSLLSGEEFFSLPLLPYLWNKLWKRSLLEDNLMVADESITIGEDVAIGFPTLLQAECIVISDKAFYHYRQNCNSMLNKAKDEKNEFENAQRLFVYLTNRLGEKYYVNGLKRYYIHQQMTRSYSIVNQKMGCDGLFPFVDHIDEPVIIYGAGALGCAVYHYAKEKLVVKAWIDANAIFLRSMGYDVLSPDEFRFDPDDVIIVSIFVIRIAREIKQMLMNKGIKEKNIYLFNLTVEHEKKLTDLDDSAYEKYQL